MSLEAWAQHYIESTSLVYKLAPPPPPSAFSGSPSLRLNTPGRPPELRAAKRGDRLPKPEALREPRHRAKVLHAFLHHELQAAELMCWALLAFAEAEEEFRRGLVRVCLDEIRHMNGYKTHIETLGFRVGDFAVRDWFWTRVPRCESKIAFVAVMGMGFEAANLEHAPLFADRFEHAGDLEGAEIQRRIGLEEIAHVRFAVRWFREWTGGCDFAAWEHALPKPWSPMLMRGEVLNDDARTKAGLSPEFIAALRAYVPERHGRA